MKRKQADVKDWLAVYFPQCVSVMIESYCVYSRYTFFEKRFKKDNNGYPGELVAVDKMTWTQSRGPHYFLRSVQTKEDMIFFAHVRVTSAIIPLQFCDYGKYQAYESSKESKPQLCNHIYVFTLCPSGEIYQIK